MKPFIILIATIAVTAAAHGQIEDPVINGRRELLGRTLTLSARQGDGAGPYEGPINLPRGDEKKRQNQDAGGPFAGPEIPDGGSKKRQENQTPGGAFGGTVPSGGASRVRGRQGGELPNPVLAARQSESTGTEG